MILSNMTTVSSNCLLFVGTFLPEDKQTPSKAYQGPKFFSYNGKVLDDLRKSMEQNFNINTSDNVALSEDENE